MPKQSMTCVTFYSCPCSYSFANSPIQKELAATEVGNVACFLCSPLASAVNGHVMFVDNGLNVMGLAMDSETLKQEVK